MSKKKNYRSTMQRGTDALLLIINFFFLLLLAATGYSQLINPIYHPWLIFFSLTFPVFLVINCIFAVFWILRNPRYFRFTLIGFILCLFPIRTYFPINIQGKTPNNTIKVMSYNVKVFSSDQTKGNNNTRDILDYIGHSDADIFCCQENLYLSDNRFCKSIDSTLSRWAYQDTVHFTSRNSMGIYSNYPILSRCIIPSPSKFHGSTIYKLKIGADTIAVINCHFVSNQIDPNDKKMFKDLLTEPAENGNKSNLLYLMRKVDKAGVLRSKQVDSLIPAIEKLGNMPIIICGDFNDSPLSNVHYRLTQILNDAYTRNANGVGISYHESGMYFRLDNILYSNQWQAYETKVDNHIKASDHYPISCRLKLKKE